MLKEALNNLQVKDGDTSKTALYKAMAEGALEGFVIVGLVTTLGSILNSLKKWELSNWGELY